MTVSVTRRRLLFSSLGIFSAGVFGWLKCRQHNSGLPVYIGCSKTIAGDYAVTAINAAGDVCYQMPLPGRGHGLAISHDKARGYVFSRRPGSFLLVFDIQSGQILDAMPPPEGKFFYGHGDTLRNHLFVVEGEQASSEGVIGVYLNEPSGRLVRQGEMTGFGVGPHELRVLDDKTLAVAVGGILTKGRKPINLDTMQPSLVLLDIKSGHVKERYYLSDPKLSIRHLAISHAGDIVFAQQYKGETDNISPLLAIKRKGREITPLKASVEEWMRFKQYIGSVACTDSQIIATSPRGNCFGVWDLASGALVEMGALVDAAGAAGAGEHFALSSGSGRLVIKKERKSLLYQSSNVNWDNHWVML